jgi:ATP-binding cassette subfamily C protein
MSRLLASAASVRVGQAALDVITEDLDEMGIERLSEVTLPAAPAGLGGEGEGPERLELDAVSFAYAGTDNPALDGVNLVVEPGRSLGVVGPSGAGKSTLIDIVCGIRGPDEGTVRVDGEELSVDVGVLERRIGLVPQDVFLVDGPIRRNVTFGLVDDEERVWEALGRAQLDDFVRQLPAGINTVVGERGARLSGGQRQRLGIARALYGRPSILVLDEATAALDVETEAAVVEAVRALAGELSLVVVAHRLSTIRDCDQVAYLDKGRILAVGTFTEVAEQVPEFARAVELAGMQVGGPPG